MSDEEQEEKSGSEIFEEYIQYKKFYSFEGDRGYKQLNTLAEDLGYGTGFMRNRALEEFLTDNPGACQAIVEWIEEWMDKIPEWKEKLESELPELEDDEGDDIGTPGDHGDGHYLAYHDDREDFGSDMGISPSFDEPYFPE